MIHLDYRDNRPIYEQVRDGLRKLMVTGMLRPGDKLPSVRALAVELAINPNTIQRAYAELEREGFIYSIPGKGCFAAGELESTLRRKEDLMERLRELVAELRYLQVTDEEIFALVREGGAQ